MRIISGWLKGRSFDAPRGFRTHPMSERVKSAVFNTLGDLHDLTILDAFAGSGALGLEAISRGAKYVQAIEIDTKAYKIIVKNKERFEIGDSYKITRANCASWSKRNKDERFDIVFADPPFDKLRPDDLDQLARHVTEGGLFIVSYSSRSDTPEVEGMMVTDSRFYGDQAIAYYRHNRK